MRSTVAYERARLLTMITVGVLGLLAACGGVTPAGATVPVTVHAPFLDTAPSTAASATPTAVPAGVLRVLVTAYRLGDTVATVTLTTGNTEAAMALAPGATYEFAASVIGYAPYGVEIAWGQVSSVAEEGGRITLRATSIVHEARLGTTSYQGVDLVVPLDVFAPNGERVPPTDYDVSYSATGAAVEESTLLGVRVRPDGSGAPVAVTATVIGMNAAHESGATFVAVQSMTPNDPEVGFDFVVPQVWLSTVPNLLVNQPAVLSGNVSDDTGVVRVEVYANVSLVGVATVTQSENTLAPSAWTLPWIPSVEGDHTLTVLAYDASGNVGRADAPVTVWLAPPAATGEPYAWLTTFPELRTIHEPAGLAVDGFGDLYQVFTHPALPTDPHDFNVGVVSKHRGDGATYWVRQYEGQFHMHFFAAAGTHDGVVVGGRTAGTVAGAVETGLGEAFVMKLTASGEIAWLTRIAPDPSYGINAYVHVTDAAVAANGDIVVVGGVTGVSVHRDAFVARFASSGTLLWDMTFGTSDSDGASVVSAAADGGAYVAGFTHGSFGDFSKPSLSYEDVFVAFVSPHGELEWVTQFGSANQDWVQGLTPAPGGGVYGVAITLGTFPGETRTSAPGSGEGATFNVSDDGSLQWLTQFATNMNTWPRAIVTDDAGDPHVVGSTRGAFPGQVSAGNLDVFHARFTPGGALASVRQFGSSRHDQAWHAVWHAGGLYAMGDYDFDNTINDRLRARRFLARIEP